MITTNRMYFVLSLSLASSALLYGVKEGPCGLSYSSEGERPVQEEKVSTFSVRAYASDFPGAHYVPYSPIRVKAIISGTGNLDSAKKQTDKK